MVYEDRLGKNTSGERKIDILTPKQASDAYIELAAKGLASEQRAKMVAPSA